MTGCRIAWTPRSARCTGPRTPGGTVTTRAAGQLLKLNLSRIPVALGIDRRLVQDVGRKIPHGVALDQPPADRDPLVRVINA